MAFGRPHGPNDPSVLNSIETALSTVRRGNLLVRLWHWRYEAGLLIGLAISALFVWSTLGLAGLTATGVAALGLLVAALVWPASRQRLIARAWCVITPHRVRTGCVHAWVQNRDGRLPTVIYTVPTEFGERLMLWCRPGILPRDLIAARETLRAACWASDVRVLVDDRRSHIVVLEVIRRFPPEPPVGAEPATPSWPFQDRAEGDSADPEEPALYAGQDWRHPSG
jgi:hypothetical protein